MQQDASVSFCISTYKRPGLLFEQLTLLLKQEFRAFEIVISDNDPEASAKEIAESFQDIRIRYFHNAMNLGMVKSFNLSIERARTEFIVMVTDDDPVDPGFLKVMFELYDESPGYSVYGGFLRSSTSPGEIEVISKENFLQEILDTDKTPSILWSSCMMRKADMLQVGLMPDYGSPHLADHALIAMAGSINGGKIINQMYSSLTSHNTNFSKSHIDAYLDGCKGFYETMTTFENKYAFISNIVPVVKKHLGVWFIGSFFILKKYYTIYKPDPEIERQVNLFAEKILLLSFMKKFRIKFRIKQFIFRVKKRLHLLK